MKKNKHLIKLLLIIIIQSKVFAQLNFTESPQNYQLFPRDATNNAIVTFEGNITNLDYKKISVYVKKENVFYSYQTQSRAIDNTGTFHFNLQPQISALPVEYDFRVYLHNANGDSAEVLHRERILCGDIYVLYGQSNMKALVDMDELNAEIDDRLLRNFDFDDGNVQVTSLKWFPSKQPFGHVGGVGMPLQKLILEKYGIPTCIINGAYGGYMITGLNNRNNGNPFDLNTAYGQLYTRVKYANAIGKIKAIIWRQGESEACSWYVDINNYPANFTSLYNNLKADLGNVNRFYNIQITIQSCNFLEDAGKLREYMRKTKYLFDNIETSTALGIPVVDGFHHSKQGNQQMTNEVFQMIKRDIYHSDETIEVHPPDIQKIYKSSSGDTLTLAFEEGQKMKYPNDSTVNSFVWRMNDYLYVNSSTGLNTNLIDNGWATENKIFLKLNTPVNSGYLTYLPSYSTLNPPVQIEHLKNSKGLRAMAFYQFPIASILPTPNIESIENLSEGHLKLFFNDAETKVIERKINGESNFTVVGRVTDNSFIDNFNFANIATVYYRIKKETLVSESKYSSVKSINLGIIDNCNNDLILSGNVAFETLRKGKKIESIQKIAAKTSYSFQKSVELKAGFETQNNVVFKVDNSGCN